MEWDHKDEWRIRSKSFMVTVTRHNAEIPEDRQHYEGKNRWCVYAWIYTDNPLNEKFDSDSMFQEQCQALPLHAGCSFFKRHENGTVQVGADYNHLYDDHFCHYETKEDARQVFRDAEELYEHLKARE